MAKLPVDINILIFCSPFITLLDPDRLNDTKVEGVNFSFLKFTLVSEELPCVWFSHQRYENVDGISQETHE
jgi:hypothetical protein